MNCPHHTAILAIQFDEASLKHLAILPIDDVRRRIILKAKGLIFITLSHDRF